MPQKIISLQSRNFLSLTTDEQLEYLESAAGMPIKKAPEVACMTTLKMNSIDRSSVSCLIVGTEDGDIIILESQTFTQIAEVS